MKKFFFILFPLGFLSPVWSQDFFFSKNLADIKVEQLTEQQIQQFKRQIQNANLTEMQATELAKRKGMSEDDIQKLKDRMSVLDILSGTAFTKEQSEVKRQDTAGVSDKIIDRKATPLIEKIFGSELFTNAQMTFNPNLSIATPENYELGTGDVINVLVYGYQEASYQLTITKDGFVNIPRIGVVTLNGLSIKAAKVLLKKKFIQNGYASLGNGQSELSLNLENIRSIHVTVIGANRSGNYMLPAVATVFHALYVSQGPASNGSYRGIQLIRNGILKHTIDLYPLLCRGDNSADIGLRDGDILYIPLYLSRISIAGQVKRPGLFELLPKENLENLLYYAGGFNEIAFKNHVYIEQLTSKELRVQDVYADSFARFMPQSGDKIFVSGILNRFQNQTSIMGNVKRQGKYELTQGMQLSDLIAKADGLKENALTHRALIIRKGFDNKLQFVHFDPLLAIRHDPLHDLLLQNLDSVVIEDQQIINPLQFVEILGEVNKPGTFVHGENLCLKDVLFLANGFTQYANIRDIEVYRSVASSQSNNNSMALLKAPILDTLKSVSQELILLANDVVVVRKKTSGIAQGFVYVEGAVSNGGSFPILNNRFTLSQLMAQLEKPDLSFDPNGVYIVRNRDIVPHIDLFKEKIASPASMVGGLNDTSTSKFVLPTFIKQKTLLISVDYKKILSGRKKFDIELLNQDKIVFSKFSNTVTLMGGVQNPTVLTYKTNKRCGFFIDRAGGLTQNSIRKQTFVIYPNGQSKKSRHFLFINWYPRAIPGALVIVPEKDLSTVQTSMEPSVKVALFSIISSTLTMMYQVLTK